MKEHDPSKETNDKNNIDEIFTEIIGQNDLTELEQDEEIRQARIRLKGHYALQSELGYPDEEVEEDEED